MQNKELWARHIFTNTDTTLASYFSKTVHVQSACIPVAQLKDQSQSI